MSESRLVIAADFSFCKRKREHACALEVSKRGHACDGARGDSTGRADRAMGRIEQNRAIAFHAPTPPLLAQVPRAAVRCATSPLFSGWHWTPARAQSGRPHHAVGHSCWRWRPPGATLDRSESPTTPCPPSPMAATRRNPILFVLAGKNPVRDAQCISCRGSHAQWHDSCACQDAACAWWGGAACRQYRVGRGP